MKAEVVLVPVSVQMGEPLRVVGFRTGDAWARRPVRGSAKATAQALIHELPPEYRFIIEKLGLEAAKVTFTEDLVDGEPRLNLIYSIALPAPLVHPDAQGVDRWTWLLRSGGSQSQARKQGRLLVNQDEEYAGAVVEYWREELEEETRLFAFLPRYFTARQARDVYSAFWGYEQDPDGFATWSGIGLKKKGVLSEHVAEVDLADGDLVPQFEAVVVEADSVVRDKARTDTFGTVGAAVLSSSASEGAVGLDPTNDPSGSDRAPLLLLIAASLVAFQRKSRGPKPTWYQRRAERPFEKRLERLYSPRAVWVFEPQV